MAARIAFAGGGTLGSVTPLLAAAAAVRELEPAAEFLWIGTAGGPEAGLVAAAGIPFRAVSSGKLRRYLAWRNLTDLGRIVRGFCQCWRLFGRWRPDVLASAGSFVAVPAVWAARLRGVPVHVHQMDIRPGLANRLTAPFAASVSVAFESSLRDFASRRPVWTGNPVRAGLFTGSRTEARRLFHLEADLPTVLVMGGGTGAVSLNDLVRRAAPALTAGCQVIHLTGRGKAETPAALPARYHQLEFLAEDMRHAYAAADLVVTRAGMGALTELAALGLPTAIVPMPDSHQEENAAWFAARGAAVVWNEKGSTAEGLAGAVLGLLRDAPRLEGLRSSLKRLNRADAAQALARLILASARGPGRPS